jgi:hypothetical protein
MVDPFLGLPIVHFAFLGVDFYLDFSPFYFFFLPWSFVWTLVLSIFFSCVVFCLDFGPIYVLLLCGLLFGLWSYLFSSLVWSFVWTSVLFMFIFVPLPNVFPFIIYLFLGWFPPSVHAQSLQTVCPSCQPPTKVLPTFELCSYKGAFQC